MFVFPSVNIATNSVYLSQHKTVPPCLVSQSGWHPPCQLCCFANSDSSIPWTFEDRVALTIHNTILGFCCKIVSRLWQQNTKHNFHNSMGMGQSVVVDSAPGPSNNGSMASSTTDAVVTFHLQQRIITHQSRCPKFFKHLMMSWEHRAILQSNQMMPHKLWHKKFGLAPHSRWILNIFKIIGQKFAKIAQC